MGSDCINSSSLLIFLPQGSPGVDHNMLFLSSPYLCFIIVFICDLFVSRDDPLMSKKTFTRTEQLTICFKP